MQDQLVHWKNFWIERYVQVTKTSVQLSSRFQQTTNQSKFLQIKIHWLTVDRLQASSPVPFSSRPRKSACGGQIPVLLSQTPPVAHRFSPHNLFPELPTWLCVLCGTPCSGETARVRFTGLQQEGLRLVKGCEFRLLHTALFAVYACPPP